MIYNKKTKIGDADIELSEKETKDVSKFHKSRIAFAFLEDGTMACNVNDEREHRVYLEEDFGVDEERFQKLVRGYIKPGRIVFYKSSKFLMIDEDIMPYIEHVGVLAVQSFGHGRYEVWNGVTVGKPGDEWEPVEVLCTIDLDLTFSRKKHDLSISLIS